MLPNRVAFNMSRDQSDALDTPPRITVDTRLTRAQAADASVVLFWAEHVTRVVRM